MSTELISMIFSGFSSPLIGYLIFRSTFLPLADYLSPYNLALDLLGQESAMRWFLVMGVNVQPWKEQANAGGKPPYIAAAARPLS